MTNDLFDLISSLRRYVAEKDISGIIHVLRVYTNGKIEDEMSMTYEIFRLPFECTELFEDKLLFKAWRAAMKCKEETNFNENLHLRLHELIMERDKRAVKILRYFYAALGREILITHEYLHVYSFQCLMDIAMAMDDTDFMMTAYELFLKNKNEWCLYMSHGSVLLKFFISKKMYAEAESVFKEFFNNDIFTYLSCIDVDGRDVYDIKTASSMIDHFVDEPSRPAARKRLFSQFARRIIYENKELKQERIKRLSYFKEVGFKIKDATEIMWLVNDIDDEEALSCCKDLLADDAVLYIQNLCGNNVKDIQNDIAGVMKVLPDIKLSIDNPPDSENICIYGQWPTYNRSFLKPILKKHKICFNGNVAENKYIKELSERKSKALIPLIDYLCLNYEDSIDSLVEFFTKNKNLEALQAIMRYRQ